MGAPAFDQKTNPIPTKFPVEQTLPSKEELKNQIEQLINEDYQKSKRVSFGIIAAVAIWIITMGTIWHAWL